MLLSVQMMNAEQILKPLKGMGKETKLAINASLRRAGTTLRSRLAQGIRRESYLKGASLKNAVQKPVLEDDAVRVTVSGHRHGADSFRLVPNRITARKGMRSVDWPEAGFQIGPSMPVWNAKRDGGLSKAFVLNVKGYKRMFQKKGREFVRVPGVTPQYFSVFSKVRETALQAGKEMFEKRLAHEVMYRLGLK